MKKRESVKLSKFAERLLLYRYILDTGRLPPWAKGEEGELKFVGKLLDCTPDQVRKGHEELLLLGFVSHDGEEIRNE